MADRTPGNGRRDRGRRRARLGLCRRRRPAWSRPSWVQVSPGFRVMCSSRATSKSSPNSSYLLRRASNSRRNCSFAPSSLGTTALSSFCSLLTCVLGSLLTRSGLSRPAVRLRPHDDRAPARHDPRSVFTAGHGSCVPLSCATTAIHPGSCRRRCRRGRAAIESARWNCVAIADGGAPGPRRKG